MATKKVVTVMPWTVQTETQSIKEQQEDIDKVATALNVKPGVAEFLLRHYNWSDPEKVIQDWLYNPKKTPARMVKEAGLTWDAAMSDTWVSPKGGKCNKCHGSFNTGQMMSAGCDHYFCDACWSLHFCNKVKKDGGQGTPLRCPSCPVPVIRDLIKRLRMTEDESKERDKYNKLRFTSYVDDTKGRRRWCNTTGCGCVFTFRDDCIGLQKPVTCSHGHTITLTPL